MTGRMDSVVHFQMPYENRERMAKFYRTAFGWQTQVLGAEMGNYVVVTTAESDANGPKERGRINGGFFAKTPEMGAVQVTNIVLAVEDLPTAMKRVTNAGGKIVGKPMDVPGIGRYVSFADTEGNIEGLLQPAPQATLASQTK